MKKIPLSHSRIFATIFSLSTLFALAHPARAEDATKQGVQSEAEAGVVINAGNAESKSYNLKDLTSYTFSGNDFTLGGHYQETTARETTVARNWDLNLRYERVIFGDIGGFAAEQIEGNTFAGFLQRYNTDIGAKYSIFKTDKYYWNVEGGYRYSTQNSSLGVRTNGHFARLYTEGNRQWNEHFSTKLWFEYLPSLTDALGTRLNTELSLSAVLTSIFSVKSAYGIQFNNTPVAPALKKTDTLLTTALVAKF